MLFENPKMKRIMEKETDDGKMYLIWHEYYEEYQIIGSDMYEYVNIKPQVGKEKAIEIFKIL